MSANGADWFVRAKSKQRQYGQQNGTCFDHAWNGLSAIRWGQDGVQPGDTLWICGIHPHPDDSLGLDHNDQYLDVGMSGTAGRPITIRGDWAGHPGTIVRTRFILRWQKKNPAADGWVYVPEVDAYRRGPVHGTLTNPIEYNHDTGQFQRLRLASHHPQAGAGEWRAAGVVSHRKSDGMYFYKPSAGVAESRLFNDSFIAVKISGKDHIHLKHLTLVGGGRAQSLLWINDGADFATVDHVSIAYAGYDAIRINGKGAAAPCNDTAISNCVISSPQRAGIYLIFGGQQSDRHHIHRNRIENCDPDNQWSPHPDDHGIQLERGNNHLVEHNTIRHFGGHGIGLDFGSQGQQKDNIIRFNHIDGQTQAKPWGNEIGICLEGILDTIQPNDHTGNQVYGNTVANCAFAGISVTSCGVPDRGPKLRVYNNTLAGNERSLYFADAFNARGKWQPGFTFIRNISYAPLSYHIFHKFDAKGRNWSAIEIDNNLYFDGRGSGKKRFRWKHRELPSFADWVRTTAGDGNPQDRHSPEPADPMFMAPRKQDFRLQPKSPGVRLGLGASMVMDQ